MSLGSRAERLERIRGRRKRVWLGAIAGAALIVVVAVLIGIQLAHPPQAAPDAPVSLASASEETTLPSSASTSTVPVEVPVLTGMSITEAEVLVKAAGLALVRVPTPAGDAAEGLVLSQEPQAGSRVGAGTSIQLTYADTPAAAAAAASASVSSKSTGLVVCIDPGHQASANNGSEPVGPGASESKPKVTGGAVGAVTHAPEHQVVLALSLKVKERLERYGVAVVMTRTTANVDISNSQRAVVANQAGADLFLRIHADSNTNADIRGISTLYPSGNDWVAPIEQQSLTAAGIIQKALLASTGATDRGVVKRADLAGFNYCTVPAVLVETGFLSNPVDDRQLSDPAYQDTLADAIARGVLDYLGVTR